MIVLVSFFVFLLSVYLLGREDFVFMRRNVSIEQLFDVAFLNGFLALFSARIAFVAFHFTFAYLNPLVFFLVPYFPGLGISGAIVGSFFFLLWISKSKKIPTGRLLDVFSVGFSYAFSASLLGYSLVSLVSKQFLVGAVDGVWAIITLALSILFGSICMKSVWKDGSMSAVVITGISGIVILTRSIIMFSHKPFILDKELFLIAGILVGAIVIGIGKSFMQRSRL